MHWDLQLETSPLKEVDEDPGEWRRTWRGWLMRLCSTPTNSERWECAAMVKVSAFTNCWLCLLHTWNGLCSWRKYAPEANTSLNICSIIVSYKTKYGLHFLVLGRIKNLLILPWEREALGLPPAQAHEVAALVRMRGCARSSLVFLRPPSHPALGFFSRIT